MAKTFRSDFSGELARREKRLAFLLLLPTFFSDFGNVLLPLIANFDFLQTYYFERSAPAVFDH